MQTKGIVIKGGNKNGTQWAYLRLLEGVNVC
jgi:hypothetical protein